MPAPIPNIPAFDRVTFTVPNTSPPYLVTTNYAVEGVERIQVVSEESEAMTRGPFGQFDEFLFAKPESIVQPYALRGWTVRDLGPGIDVATVTYLNAGYSQSTMVFTAPSGDLHLPYDSRGIVSVEVEVDGDSYQHSIGYTAFVYARYVQPPDPHDPVEPGDIVEDDAYLVEGQARRLLEPAEWVLSEPRLVELIPELVPGTTVLLDYTYATRPSIS